MKTKNYMLCAYNKLFYPFLNSIRFSYTKTNTNSKPSFKRFKFPFRLFLDKKKHTKKLNLEFMHKHVSTHCSRGRSLKTIMNDHIKGFPFPHELQW